MHTFVLDLGCFSSLRPFGGGSNLVVRPPLCFAYKKKTRKKWKYNHLKSKSQKWAAPGLRPGRVCGVLLIPGAGTRGPLICVQQSGLAASGSGAEQRPDNWPAPAPCPQCPHSAAHLLTLHLRPSTPHHHTKPSVTAPGDGPYLQSRVYEDTPRFICRYLTIRCSCSYLVAVLC